MRGIVAGALLLLVSAGVGAYLVPWREAPTRPEAAVRKDAPEPGRLSFAAPMLAQAGLAAEQTVNSPESSVNSAPAAPPARVVVTDDAVRRPVGVYPGAVSHLEGAALTREMQRELRRVGCFHGPVTGAWTPSTRAAMKDFTRRMNASLPVDEPDQILLAMLRSHADNACAKDCVAGHERGSERRCIESAVADRPGKLTSVTHVGASDGRSLPAPVPPPALSPELSGRMALAGPKNAEEASDPPATERPADRAHSQPRHSERSRQRRMGSWLFYDAPVDRQLAR